MPHKRKLIAIVDCSIKHQFIRCFNKLVETQNHQFTYHIPSFYGLSSLLMQKKFDGIIVLGSNSNVSDQFDWHIQLANFIQTKLKVGVPTLGICFGHQLIAHSFGATIDYVYEDKKKLAGPREITFLKDSYGFKKNQSLTVGVAHYQEIKTLPKDLIQLATSPTIKYEVVTHKNLPFLGIQGHPESSVDFIRRNIEEEMEQPFMDQIIHGGETFIDHFIKSL